MSKIRQSNKEQKKQAARTPKEKKAEKLVKQAKKQAHDMSRLIIRENSRGASRPASAHS